MNELDFMSYDSAKASKNRDLSSGVIEECGFFVFGRNMRALQADSMRRLVVLQVVDLLLVHFQALLLADPLPKTAGRAIHIRS